MAKLPRRNITQHRKQNQLAAVRENGYAIRNIENPDKDVQVAAVRKNPDAIRYIKDPCIEAQLEAVKRKKEVIRYIQNPDKAAQLEAVRQDAYIIRLIKNPHKETQLEAVKKHGAAIRYIKDPDKEVQLAAVSQDGCAIRHIKNPDKEVQLAAVRQNGYAIRYIKTPDKDVQMEAVKRQGLAIQYIKDPDREVRLEAIRSDARAVAYISGPLEKEEVDALCAALEKGDLADRQLLRSAAVYEAAERFPELGERIEEAAGRVYENLENKGAVFIDEDTGIAVFTGKDALDDLKETKKDLASIVFPQLEEQNQKTGRLFFITRDPGEDRFSVLEVDAVYDGRGKGFEERKTVLSGKGINDVLHKIESLAQSEGPKNIDLMEKLIVMRKMIREYGRSGLPDRSVRDTVGKELRE